MSQMMIMGGDKKFIHKVVVVATLIFTLLQLIGLGMGVTGLFSKQTKKLFPIISISLNGILLLSGIALIAVLIIKIP